MKGKSVIMGGKIMKTRGLKCLLLIFLVISLLSGCVNHNEEIDDGRVRVDNFRGAYPGKVLPTDYLGFAIDKTVYIDEIIYMELSYGTRFRKGYAYRGLLEIYAYTVEDYHDNEIMQDIIDLIVSKNYPANVELLFTSDDDFYVENYPYPKKRKEAVTTEIILPNHLLVGQSGCIIFFMNYDSRLFLYYAKENDKIIFSNTKLSD